LLAKLAGGAGDLQADAMKQANNLARFWSAIASD
jgi:hypothetical protein